MDPDQAGHFVRPDLCPNCLQTIFEQTTLVGREVNLQGIPGQEEYDKTIDLHPETHSARSKSIKYE